MTPKQIEQINRGIAEKIGWKDIGRPSGIMQRPDNYHYDYPPDFATDERTRPQLLAALSEEEKDKLCELALAEYCVTPLETPKAALYIILTMRQSDLALLFCAVKNIEIDL